MFDSIFIKKRILWEFQTILDIFVLPYEILHADTIINKQLKFYGTYEAHILWNTATVSPNLGFVTKSNEILLYFFLTPMRICERQKVLQA